MSFVNRSVVNPDSYFLNCNKRSRRPGRNEWPLNPVASALTVMLAAGIWSAPAQAQVQGAWFAQGNSQQFQQHSQAARQHAASAASQGPNIAQQQAAARAQLAQSLDNLNRTAHAIAAQQAAQNAARLAALQQASDVADGLAQGGLEVATGDKALWQGASAPVASSKDGHHTVAIAQTEAKAILNWNRFDVGRNTTVEFQQKNTDAVLNRIVGEQTTPSQIQGKIKGDGTVMVVNQNGIVFSGTSQVNVRNLVAAAANINDEQFLKRGIYSPEGSNTAAFTQAEGRIEIQAGAQIHTHTPNKSTIGGGYVLLLAKDIQQDGTITAQQGQVALAAGDSFIIRKGQGTEGNQQSTVRGNEVLPSGQGSINNTGLIQARAGDISLNANSITQAGVLSSTTTQNQRGTVHLTAAGAEANILLASHSVTAIEVESGGQALDGQRDSLLAPALDGTAQNMVPGDAFRRDLSLIHLKSADTIELQGESLTLATGGHIALSAARRSLMRSGARLDVSGALDVPMAMSVNNLDVNVQGNEQRDAPNNRDSKNLNNSTLWLDRRFFVHVAAGTNGYEGERWYTQGGLLEVGGYLSNSQHSTAEWLAQGGTVQFSGGEVVTQQGSSINLSGGTLAVQSGYLKQSWLRADDGRLYTADRAPGDLLYQKGVYQGYEQHSQRWGAKRLFASPLLAPQQRFEHGYLVGRDAGRLIIDTPQAVLEGELISQIYNSPQQHSAAPVGADGYGLPHHSRARRAELIVGRYTPTYIKDEQRLVYQLQPRAQAITLGRLDQTQADDWDLDTALPEAQKNTIHLNSLALNQLPLGALRLAAENSITLLDELQLAAGGQLQFYSPQIHIGAGIYSPGGQVDLGNVLYQSRGDRFEDGWLAPQAGQDAYVWLAPKVAINTQGVWNNLSTGPQGALPYIHGGRVSLRSTGNITLEHDSLINVSAGATLNAKHKVQGGRGGSITLQAGHSGAQPADIHLHGRLQAYGFSDSGTLNWQQNSAITLGEGVFSADFFRAGFAHYILASLQGIALDSELHIQRPVLQSRAYASNIATGPAHTALQAYLPELHQADPLTRTLQQRAGASLTLQAGLRFLAPDDTPSINIGKHALLSVDPGQRIGLYSVGNTEIAGRIQAWGGQIDIGRVWQGKGSGDLYTAITLRPGASLDVSGQAYTAMDRYGQRYGQVQAGGSITLGGAFNHHNGSIGQKNPITGDPSDADSVFIVVHQGALLDASGTQAPLHIPGLGTQAVASQGGSISLASSAGLYLDGQLMARAGGPGAAGGHLTLALDTPFSNFDASDVVREAREFILTPDYQASTHQNLHYGHARYSAEQLKTSGMGTLSVYSDGILSLNDDLVLQLPQALHIYARVIGWAESSATAGSVYFNAPYVKLAGPGTNVSKEGSPTIHPTLSGNKPSAQQPLGRLHIQATALLDIQDAVSIGGSGGTSSTEGLGKLVDRRGFNDVLIGSEGDVRLLTTHQNYLTRLYAPANLTLRAAQLYPVTGTQATVLAGWGAASDSEYTLHVQRAGDANPALPYSVFGHLILDAPRIVQEGIIRAPLGQITLGSNDYSDYTQHLLLGAGSVTSVSAAGLIMPYGGTVDDIEWLYRGKQIQLQGAGNPGAGHIALRGQYIELAENALIDLSGGGSLSGAGFVSGRGGSSDARYHPLMQHSAQGFSLPSLKGRAIYAIVPGTQTRYTPSQAEQASPPVAGQQITVPPGVPGLAAGTYTLLPASYALLPGAFRVEINQQAYTSPATKPTAMRNGSWASSAVLSLQHTDVHDTLARPIVLTAADTLRRYASYHESSYTDYAIKDAARRGIPRAQIEADGKLLWIEPRERNKELDRLSLSLRGTVQGPAAPGGYGSSIAITGRANIEVLADGTTPNAKYGIALLASDLSRQNVNRISLGGLPRIDYERNPNLVQITGVVDNISDSGSLGVTLRSGALLQAPEILLISNDYTPTGIVIEQGAILNTLGRGAPAFSSDDGYIFQAGNLAVVALSNGPMQWLAPVPDGDNKLSAPISIGHCPDSTCTNPTRLYSEGTLAFLTNNQFKLSDQVRYGTRHLSLGADAFHIGSTQALERAAQAGVLTPGLRLSEADFQRLLQGDTAWGAPAMQTLELIAGRSMNFFGDVTLSTLNAAGQSTMDNLLLTTPAIYGYGQANEQATIRTGHLIWNGSSTPAADVVRGGAGTGDGRFTVEAQRITLGFGPWSQPDGDSIAARLLLGFKQAHLNASTAFSANNQGKLSFYHSRGHDYDAVKGYHYSGGDLSINTPLLTGMAGSSSSIVAGGSISLHNPDGTAKVDDGLNALGAELSLQAGGSLHLDTAVLLPSGKLSLKAQHDLELGSQAQLDLAGRAVTYFDDAAATQYSWGGDVSLESLAGNIRQAPESVINISARNNQAGRLSAKASHTEQGMVWLQGALLGQASGSYNAGGTVLPYTQGGIIVQAQRLGHGDLSSDFADLNEGLNTGEVFGLRRFQLLQGDLTLGDELRAHEVDLSLDKGHLSVLGKVDASGAQVGSIRLAAKHGLTLGSHALLDAHGSLARIDSYGQLIFAPNRAMVELNSGAGRLHSQSGARVDLRYGTADPRLAAVLHHPDLGMLDLYAPRLHGATHGDINIQLDTGLTVQGARAIAVYGRQAYTDAPYGTDPAASGKTYQVITQAYLDAKHAESTLFIDAALANTHLRQQKLAGLGQSYGSLLHLRPAVEILSATEQGDLLVSGDLDLSGHRYASLNPHRQKTAVYGSGEPGTLSLRAGGDLSIYGSINDGFAPPPETPDDNGWLLTPGVLAFGSEILVPGSGVTLGKGTRFASGNTLNYAIPIQPRLAAGVVLPVPAVLDSALTIPAGYALNGPVHAANGELLYEAGTVLATATTLPARTQLGAGFRLPAAANFQSFDWPAGVPLPETTSSYTLGTAVELVADLPLRMGSLIPSMTDVKLPDDAISTPLRPLQGGRMGQNWAIAPMLPENSLSWNLRLVAGADTQAVDSRSLQQGAPGSMSLGDTHYTIFNQHQTTEIIIPGTPEQPGGAWYWNDSANELSPEFQADTPVSSEWEELCDYGYCNRVQYIWNENAVELDPEFIAGAPVSSELEELCDYGYCVSLGETIPATPDQTIISEVNKKFAASHLLSVLRTGTGHLDLISQGSVALLSPYGIYTAGTHTASAAGAQKADFNRARGKAADGTYLNSSQSMAPSDGSGPAPGPGYEATIHGAENSSYAAWYPEHGGNLLLYTGADLTGDNWSAYFSAYPVTDAREINSSGFVTNWLWRQASGDTAGIDPIPTAWWLNFGTYVPGTTDRINDYRDPELDETHINGLIATPELIGFTGIATLGGGNLSLDITGQAGTLQRKGANEREWSRSQALNLAVASTGRVLADGSLLQTGGGDMHLRLGGGWNPDMAARAFISSQYRNQQQNPNLLGTVTQLRGDLHTLSSSLGGIKQFYTRSPEGTDLRETRAYDPYTAQRGFANGGITLILGDSHARLQTRGNLVITGTADATRSALPYSLPYTYEGQAYESGGQAWFSLWTENTAIQLFSAGGHVAPLAQSYIRTKTYQPYQHTATDGWQVYPSQLHVVATSGSILLQQSEIAHRYPDSNAPVLLAPSRLGRLSLLAQDSIYTAGISISRSGNLQAINSPFRPAFMARLTDINQSLVTHNLTADAMNPATGQYRSLFSFGIPNAALADPSNSQHSRFYAHRGDIIGLESGGVITFSKSGPRSGQTWHEGHDPVWIRAGRDIVRSGNLLGKGNETSMPSAVGSMVGTRGYSSANRTSNLFVHHHSTDVSVVQAGRDILFSHFQVAGPGTLDISAGRHIIMAGQIDDISKAGVSSGNTGIRSLGPIVAGDHRPGASIAVQAGVGPGAHWDDFLQHYLDPANAALEGQPLADQPGKVVKTYHAELLDWLFERYDFQPQDDSSAVDQARAYFAALGREQQRVFARDLYFAELREGGREYNDSDGPRTGSYLRGRQAIERLFPPANVALTQGELSLFTTLHPRFDNWGDPVKDENGVQIMDARSAYIHTDAGGDIQILNPSGGVTLGLEGAAPPAEAGLITRGLGNIQLYTLNSILLGQSRIMTTFGGDIFAWSAQGDINAGRGSKTTVVYTPPRRVYDSVGNVTLSPTVPSTGAGIATLAPIPEVPAGDVDLIAPLGTIDAGEAGIRVSGNVNIAALHVVNAENIEVQGESKGIPVVAAVNVGALTSASSAASSAASAAQETIARARSEARSSQPSQIQVQVLGFGSEHSQRSPAEQGGRALDTQAASLNGTEYDHRGTVRVLSFGHLPQAMLGYLNSTERGNLEP